MSGMQRQAVTFAVETKGGVVARIGRAYMAVPEIKFRGGTVRWMADRYKETTNGKERKIWER
ncbi:MAG: hypothetical protein NC242_12885 [Roseburia sp.]|nr:hypothetical protein [Roseburia sp.]